MEHTGSKHTFQLFSRGAALNASMESNDRSLLIESPSPTNIMSGKYSPIENPKLWNGINAVCCLWSFVLLVEFVFFETPIEEREYGVELYLVWNFGTTLVSSC